MNAITLVRSFTVVLIFLAGVGASACTTTKEECIAAQFRILKAACTDPDPVKKQACIANANTEAQDSASCIACESKADRDAEKANCDGKFDNYISKLEATNAACAKAQGGDINSCTRAANACGMAPSEVESGGDLVSLMGMVMGGGGSGGGSAGACTLYDDTFEDRKAQIEDQIARLEDEKVEAVTKQAELDNELNEKKQEVNEKISELEAEFRKDEKEAKTQSMEEAADLQKKILASNKKIRDNLAKVADKNTEIANLSFGIQQIMIESSTLAMSKSCTDKVNAAKAAVMAPVVGADGKKRAPKYTMKESSKIKADLKLIESQCLQSEALKRDAQLKGIADKKRLLLVEVDTYMKSNEDEQKSIELDRKALEEKEKLLNENQKKALEEKNKKLDDLSKSVADMAAIVDRKKKALDAKIAKRDEQIMKLQQRLRDLKPRFNEVQSSIGNSRAASTAYYNACCKNGKTHTGCGQVRSESGPTGFGDMTSPDTNR